MRDTVDVPSLREQFPALYQQVRGRDLVYLDNAATTQKPFAVLREMQRYYQNDNANVHRGVHALSQRATISFDQTRAKIARHINAASEREIVFTKGCTEAINLVAHSWGLSADSKFELGGNGSVAPDRVRLEPGDGAPEIVLTTIEHHANIVPWQILAARTGARIIPVTLAPNGDLDWNAFRAAINERTALVAFVHVSNVTGILNCPGRRDRQHPALEIIDRAHEVGARVLLDAAQAMAHLEVDVQSLGIDFYAMSSHKMFGPTGVGGIYVRQEILDQMLPYQTGGNMIKKVSFEETTFASTPDRFEPGTPNIAGVIGWGAAVDFLENLPRAAIAEHEQDVIRYAIERLSQVDGVRVHSHAENCHGAVSFEIEGIHPHDAGTILDQQAIAVRTGHHCCQPLMRHLAIPASIRASFAFYNTREDVDRLVEGLARVQEVFA